MRIGIKIPNVRQISWEKLQGGEETKAGQIQGEKKGIGGKEN